jgi:prolyl-tRNA editing enzyme YbaK/EbsC (Cys-tRNA(Pro) deacylase)
VNDPTASKFGNLVLSRAVDHPELLATPVFAALSVVADADQIGVVEIDPDVADTAAFCDRYGVRTNESANCVVVDARRDGASHLAACVVLATMRTDVNGVVRRTLGARKVSFAAMTDAIAKSAMEYGGITPIGLPAGWRLLIDAAVARHPRLVVGSGLRKSKLVLPGRVVSSLPYAEIIEHLGR